MVQDHYLNHLEGGRRYFFKSSSSSSGLLFSAMPPSNNTDDLFTDDDWNDFLPTKAEEYEHGFSYPPEEDSKEEEVMDIHKSSSQDWESLISDAVQETDNKSFDLLEMALQESKANEPELSPLAMEPVQFTFDPLSFALSQDPVRSSSISPPLVTPQVTHNEPPPVKKKKLTTAEILQATLDKNRTALAMKNASHMFRGSLDSNRPFSIKNSQFLKKTIIPSATPLATTSKTSVIKLSKGSVILQIPPNIQGPRKVVVPPPSPQVVKQRSNPRSLLVTKQQPSFSLQKPRMVKILDPKTKTFKLIKLCVS